MGAGDAALDAPQTVDDFSNEWARRVLVTSKSRNDPEWLLASVLKVVSVTAKQNPNPGMLSHSFVIFVSFTEGDAQVKVEAWFAKVPKSLCTAQLDGAEVFMYNKMLPQLQDFTELKYRGREKDLRLPVARVLHAFFKDYGHQKRNIVVIENLRNAGYVPLTMETCGLAYMRAAMCCLAQFHATTFAYERYLGGKTTLLKRFHRIKERKLPKFGDMKEVITTRLLSYLEFLLAVLPDLQHQLTMLLKFERHLPTVMRCICRTKGLKSLRAVIHGDSKIDNFLFRKSHKLSMEDEYTAVLIDWQGACHDLVSSDLLWALYGFMKNLPNKNSTIDSFLDYSVAYYHQELLRFLKGFKVDVEATGLPTDEFDAVSLMKKGFVYEFLKVAIVNPVLGLRDAEGVLAWSKDKANVPLPKVEDVFKNGQNTLDFIHLYFTIATEIGVFHDLAPLCVSALREAMFSGFARCDSKDVGGDSDDSDVEADRLTPLEVAGGRQARSDPRSDAASVADSAIESDAHELTDDADDRLSYTDLAEVKEINEDPEVKPQEEKSAAPPVVLSRQTSKIEFADVLDSSDEEDAAEVVYGTIYVKAF